MNNEKKRNHVVMIFDKTFLLLRGVIAGIFGFVFWLFLANFESDGFGIIIVGGFIVLAIVLSISIIAIIVNLFIYLKSYYIVDNDKISVTRRTLFGYMKKELNYSKISTITLKKRLHHRPMNVCEVILNTSSSMSTDKNDLSIYMTVAEAIQLKKIHENYVNNKSENKSEAISTDKVTYEPYSSKIDYEIEEKMIRSFGIFKAIVHTLFLSVLQLFFGIIIFGAGVIEILVQDSFFIIAFLIIITVVGAIFNVVTRVAKLTNFKLYKTNKGYKISQGLFTSIEKNVISKNIKKINVKRIRLLNRSYISVEAVGIDNSQTNNSATDNYVRSDNIITLFDKHENTLEVLETVVPERDNLKTVEYKNKVVYSTAVISITLLTTFLAVLYYILINVIDIAAIFNIDDEKSQESMSYIIFGVFLGFIGILVLIQLYRIISFKFFKRYEYNEKYIIIKKGIIFESIEIFDKKDIQIVKVIQGPYSRLFKVNDIFFYIFKTGLGFQISTMEFISNDIVKSTLDDIKPKV